MERIASVWAGCLAPRTEEPSASAEKTPASAEKTPEGAPHDLSPPSPTHRLATALLAGSPRVAVAAPDLCRVDARGWERSGGEVALGRALREAAARAGFPRSRVGIADVAVAADAASRLADRVPSGHPGLLVGEEGVAIVRRGATREFLAPLPLSVLFLPDELDTTLRTLGFVRIGDLARRGREELESRFGPDGIHAWLLARGEDARPFRPLPPSFRYEARLELEGATETLEPLLFVLRHLLARVCADLAGDGRCAGRLSLELELAGGTRKRAKVVPARPTRRESLLHDLCRAALERSAEEGRLVAPVEAIGLSVEEAAAPGVRQGDLFAGEWRDPMAAAAALSRLHARLGEIGVVSPAPRRDHRPEVRNRWAPVTAVVCESLPRGGREIGHASVLRLLPDPIRIRVRTEKGRPVEMIDSAGRRPLIAAEGPERLSGEWWKDPYHREYFRVCTAEGELLWVYREYRRDGELRWWLHGLWD